MSRKSILEEAVEDLLTVFLEITGMSWVAGAIISGLFTLGGFMTLSWAINTTSQNNLTWLVEAITNTWMGYVPYAFSVMFFILAIVFAWRASDTYLRQSSF